MNPFNLKSALLAKHAQHVLRHRVLTTYEAEAEEVTSDDIVVKILSRIESP